MTRSRTRGADRASRAIAHPAGDHVASAPSRRGAAGALTSTNQLSVPGGAHGADVERRVARHRLAVEDVVELGVVVGGEQDPVVRGRRRPRTPSSSASPDSDGSAAGAGRPSRRVRTTRSSTSVTTASAANAPPAVSTPRTRPCAAPMRSTGVLSAQLAAERLEPAHQRQHELVHPAARVPRAEGVLDVPGDGERRRRAPRVGARVRREALDDHLQPRVARRRPRELTQRPPRLHPSASRGSGIGSPGSAAAAATAAGRSGSAQKRATSRAQVPRKRVQSRARPRRPGLQRRERTRAGRRTARRRCRRRTR